MIHNNDSLEPLVIKTYFKEELNYFYYALFYFVPSNFVCTHPDYTETEKSSPKLQNHRHCNNRSDNN